MRPWATALALGGLALTACYPQARRHQNFDLPLTAERVMRINTGDAVVSYLRQHDANPGICVPSATEPHVILGTPEDLEDVIDGVGRGAHLDKWEACVQGLLGVLPPAFAQVAVDRLLERYVERIVYPGLERDAAIRQQLDAIRRVYDERPAERQPSEEALIRWTDLMRERELFITTTGVQYRAALLAVLYLERGLLPDGTTVSMAALERLTEGNEEETLLVYSRRLPDQALRAEARRRLVRVRIRISPFAEVRANAAAVEERVLSIGTNPIALAAPPTDVQLDQSAFPFRALAIIQDVPRQRARVMSYVGSEANPAIVPPIELRGAVTFAVEGYARRVTVCAAPDSLDPTPCIAPGELGLGVGFASLDEAGRFRFAEEIGVDEVMRLVEQGDELRLPVLFRGTEVAEARWPMRFSVTNRLVLSPGYGGRGPQVSVEVDATDANIIYTAQTHGRTYRAVLEPGDMARFGVIASGGQGEPGYAGQDGTPGGDGSAGSDASCPSTNGGNGGNGGNGTAGGDGGPGGNGGPGGAVVVRLRCKRDQCREMDGVMRQTMRAPGGAAGTGGRAGRGGAGGRGGRGGNGTSCTVDNPDGQTTSSVSLSGGSNGADGAPGPDGRRGPDGRPGPTGRVMLSVQPED